MMEGTGTGLLLQLRIQKVKLHYIRMSGSEGSGTGEREDGANKGVKGYTQGAGS